MPLPPPKLSPAVPNIYHNLPPHLQQRLSQVSNGNNTESQLHRKLEQATARRARYLSRSIHLCRLTLKRVRQRQHATRQRKRAAAVRLSRRLAIADRNRARADRGKAERAREFSQRFAVGAAVWMCDFYSGYSVAATENTSCDLYQTVKRAHPMGIDNTSKCNSANIKCASVEPKLAARIVCSALRHYAVGKVLQREFPYFLEPWAPVGPSKTNSGFVSTAQNVFGPDNTLHCYETMVAFIQAPPANLVITLNLLFLNFYRCIEKEPQKAIGGSSAVGQYPRLLLSAFLVAHNSGMLGVHPTALQQARKVGMALMRLFVTTPKLHCISNVNTKQKNKNSSKNRTNNKFSAGNSHKMDTFQRFMCGNLLELAGELLNFGRLVDHDQQIAVRHVAQALVENTEIAEHYHRRYRNSTNNDIKIISNKSSSKSPISKISNNNDIKNSMSSTTLCNEKLPESLKKNFSDCTARTVALRRRSFSRYPDYIPVERFSLESDVYPALQILPLHQSGPISKVNSEEIVNKFEIDALIRVCAFEVLLDSEYRLTPEQLPAFSRLKKVYEIAGFSKRENRKTPGLLKLSSPVLHCEWFIETARAVAQLFSLIRTPAIVLTTLPNEACIRQLLLASDYDYDAVLAEVYPKYIALLGSETKNADNDKQSAIECFVNQLAETVCEEWNQKLLTKKSYCTPLIEKLMRIEPQRMAELVKTGKVVTDDDDELLATLELGSGLVTRHWTGPKRERALEILRDLYTLN